MEKLRHLAEALALMEEMGAAPDHPEKVFEAGEKVARVLQDQGSFAWFWDEFGGRLLAEAWILTDPAARSSFDESVRTAFKRYQEALTEGVPASGAGRVVDLTEREAPPVLVSDRRRASA